jgi:hypothetical protein
MAIKLIKYLRRVGLNENGIGLDFLDKFLGSLSKHGGLIHGTHKVDILSIEALCQMHESGLEAVLSIANHSI